MQHVDTENGQADAALELYQQYASRTFAYIYRLVSSQGEAIWKCITSIYGYGIVCHEKCDAV